MNTTSRADSFRVSLARALFLLRSGKFREFISAFSRKLKTNNESEDELYQNWIKKNEPDRAALNELQLWCETISEPPVFTFLVRNSTELGKLNHTLDSLRNQVFHGWRVFILGSESAKEFEQPQDNRIKTIRFEELSLRIRNGWYGEISAGDTLASFAMAELLKAIESRRNLEFIYSDHDWMNDEGVRCEPFFKPGWSPEYLQSSPYVGKLALYNLDRLPGEEILKDDQSWLRGVENTGIQAFRIPKVLYHYALKPEYSLHHAKARSNESSVSILIPTRDQCAKLKCVVNSIFEKTTHRKFEIIIVNHASSDPETLECLEEYRTHTQIRVIDFNEAFNFSTINNFAGSEARSDYLVFLNDDTEVITPSWLEELLEFCSKDEIGAVGAKLLYRDETIQHAGILIGIPEIAVHAHRGWRRDSDGYRGRLKSVQNFSAVTAACMMIRKKLFQESGGFDQNLAYAYNDVDLCLRLQERGYRIVWNPLVELYHDESASRGYEWSVEKQKRLEEESRYFLKRWQKFIQNGDPYYNPNLSLKNGAFRIQT